MTVVQNTELRDEVIRLLQNRPRTLTYAKIHADTGVSVRWLVNFGQSKIDNPGVVTVCTLRDYLTNQKP